MQLYFATESRDLVYRHLISEIAELADYFELTVYIKDSPISQDGYDNVREHLKTDLISTKRTHENAGIDSISWHSMILYRYAINSESLRFIKYNVQGLYDWGDAEIDARLLEDLTFYRNRQVIMGSVGSDKVGWLDSLTDQEVQKIITATGLTFQDGPYPW